METTLLRFTATVLLAVSLQGADPLPSWNEGPAKQAIVEFVRVTTEPDGSRFVPAPERIATFDLDGTLWVEQPMYTQVVYGLDRLRVVAEQRPELKETEPFKTVLSGDRAAIGKLSMDELQKVVTVTITGMTTEAFDAEVKQWLTAARHPRYDRPYPELVYQPMIEVLQFLRAHDFKTYIVTGSGQDFVRAFSGAALGIPPEQVVGTVMATQYGYGPDREPQLLRRSELMLNDNNAGKPEGIHLMIGRRPALAAGNSTGDQQMLEYTKAGPGARLSMLVLHDDATREYAYGPAQGLPDGTVGTFTQALYDEAKKEGWIVISMKTDWRRIFAFEP